jgi:hypothetical protein
MAAAENPAEVCGRQAAARRCVRPDLTRRGPRFEFYSVRSYERPNEQRGDFPAASQECVR